MQSRVLQQESRSRIDQFAAERVGGRGASLRAYARAGHRDIVQLGFQVYGDVRERHIEEASEPASDGIQLREQGRILQVDMRKELPPSLFRSDTTVEGMAQLGVASG